MTSTAFRLMLAVTVLGIGGHALLLPVLPLWVSTGGAGEFGAGATTGTFMAATVLTQLAVPWLLRRAGYRAVFGGGLAALGLPTPFLLLTTDLGPVLALCAVRGIGFGLLTVAGSALVAELVEPAEHGRASARYGYAIGIPVLAVLPLGVASVGYLGFTGVFVAATVAPLLGAALVPFLTPASRALPVRESRSDSPRVAPSPSASRDLAVRESGPDSGSDPPTGPHPVGPHPAGPPPARSRAARPWTAAAVGPMAAMLACSMAQGGLVTFLPLVAPAATVAVPLALFAAGLGGVVGRGIAGPLVDRRGAGRLLLPGCLTAAVGMGVGVLAVGTGAWLFVPGALAVGLGFGLVQNDSLVALFAAAGPGRYGTASAAWNIGYDGGTGAGASGLGALAQPFGFRIAFGAAALVLVAATPLLRPRRG